MLLCDKQFDSLVASETLVRSNITILLYPLLCPQSRIAVAVAALAIYISETIASNRKNITITIVSTILLVLQVTACHYLPKIGLILGKMKEPIEPRF